MKKAILFLLALKIQSAFAYPVYPDKAQNLEPYELGDFVKMYMLDKGASYPRPSWDFNADNKNFIWETNGVASSEDDEYSGDEPVKYYRDALVRLNINGAVSTELGKTTNEMAWLIKYSSYSPPKFNVERVEISSLCTGEETANNCDLSPLKSLQKVGIKYKEICSSGFPGNFTKGYEISTEGKEKSYFLYYMSEGSGASTSWFEILYDKTPNMCSSNE